MDQAASNECEQRCVSYTQLRHDGITHGLEQAQLLNEQHRVHLCGRRGLHDGGQPLHRSLTVRLVPVQQVVPLLSGQ